MLAPVACAVGAALIAASPFAWADDPPPNPIATTTTLPNVNIYPPISPVDFTVLDGAWYAFGTPNGLTCVIDKGRNAYGCSGPIPAAPEGANLVSGVGAEQPAFANSAAPLYAVAGPVKQLPPQTRLSYRNISCAIDASGATVCVNNGSQHGFVLSPAGSFTG
ncbi:MAG: hypothetical protein JO191_14260 [Mycobacteriaceae bacterium]|nr:hypothetical protein [Mycobacteriaceae bacterium]MBV9515560.1 hypothetical protein [Mycobacteriaceae bacterium]